MNNNIKKLFVLTMALATSFALCARPGPGGGGRGPSAPRGGGGRGPSAPMRHGGGPAVHHGHHHHHTGAAIGAGILGAGLVAGAIYDATRPRPPVVVERPPVVAPPPPAPVVVTPAPVVTPGHYETRVQNVWVEGRYINQSTPQGTLIRVWQPGHYEQQTTQVWVP